MTPKRIQRSRAKGWRLPTGAVVVSRPSKWGNPYRVGELVQRESALWPYLVRAIYGLVESPPVTGFVQIKPYRTATVVDAYAWWLYEQPSLMLSLDELRGKDLVCWCPLSSPCHADVLLELANPTPTPVVDMTGDTE